MSALLNFSCIVLNNSSRDSDTVILFPENHIGFFPHCCPGNQSVNCLKSMSKAFPNLINKQVIVPFVNFLDCRCSHC